jgi:hypothetical protein
MLWVRTLRPWATSAPSGTGIGRKPVTPKSGQPGRVLGPDFLGQQRVDLTVGIQSGQVMVVRNLGFSTMTSRR